MIIYREAVTSKNGLPLKGLSVAVLNATTLAPVTVYDADTGLIVQAQPLTTDIYGEFAFRVVGGEYLVRVYGSGFDEKLYRITIGVDPDDDTVTLTGDVTGSGMGAVATTVASVGGSTAVNVHSAELAANAATNVNTASAIVKRDASGNFSASTVSAALTGNASTATALQTSRTIDGQAFDGSANITVIAPGTHAAASKGTPVDADELPLVDSAASSVLKKLTWANAKATLKTYFDTLYAAVTYPFTIAQGGTNSIAALNNNRMMVSVGGAIVERAAQTASAPMRTDGSGLPTTGVTSLTTEVSGTLQAAQAPAFTGDVTTAGGSLTTALVNVPSGTPHAGSSLFTAIAAPATPAAGSASVFVDSTSKNLAVKNDAGTVNHGVQTKAAVASNFLTSISDAGAVTAAQPAFTDISGTNTVAKGGTGVATLTAHGVLVGEGTGNVVATAVGATNTVLHGNTGADPSFSAVVEADMSTSDVTTNDVSTAKHGFAPKSPNDATKFLDGTGAYSVPAGTGAAASVPVRQTVLTSPTSSGVPNFLAAGSGLNVDLANNSASAPVVISFANGFDTTGALDSVTKLTATASSIVALPASNLSFITADYVSTSSVTWGSTLCPIQYGYTYDRTLQSLCHFNGANNATTFLDDYGNTWAANGGAKLDTSQSKFGTASLNTVTAGSSASSSSFTKLGDKSWSLECWVRFNALPGSGTTMGILSAKAAAGLALGLNNTSGTYKLNLWLSSNNSTFDIANGTAGAALTTPLVNTWYHVHVSYDDVAGKYFAQFDGSATGVVTVASTTRLAAITSINLGANSNGVTNDFNGWIDEFRLSPCCRYPNGNAFTPSASAFDATASGQSSDWFDLNTMLLKSVSAASGSAATDPTFTSAKRVYVGEATTTASAFAASNPINYSLRGRFESSVAANINTSTITSYSHNLGIKPKYIQLTAVNIKTDNSWLPGDEISNYPNYSAPLLAVGSDRKTATLNTGGTVLEIMSKSVAGTAVAATAGSWGWRLTAERGW